MPIETQGTAKGLEPERIGESEKHLLSPIGVDDEEGDLPGKDSSSSERATKVPFHNGAEDELLRSSFHPILFPVGLPFFDEPPVHPGKDFLPPPPPLERLCGNKVRTENLSIGSLQVGSLSPPPMMTRSRGGEEGREGFTPRLYRRRRVLSPGPSL